MKKKAETTPIDLAVALVEKDRRWHETHRSCTSRGQEWKDGFLAGMRQTELLLSRVKAELKRRRANALLMESRP